MTEADHPTAFSGRDAPTTSAGDLAAFEAGVPHWAGERDRHGRWAPVDMPALVVVAPHPDDEVVGAGALLGAAVRAGVPVTVVAVTDGEGSHPAAAIDPEELARIRTRESEAALAEFDRLAPAGGSGAGIRRIRLGLPDGHVAGGEDQAVDGIAAVLEQQPAGTWLAAPLCVDGHPDHDASGRAARRAAARFPSVRVVEFPVWLWQHSLPGAHLEVEWDAARAIDVDDELFTARERAVAAFRSQISLEHGVPVDRTGDDPETAVVLPPQVRERMLRRRQIVFPHPGGGFAALYAHGEDPWNLADRWYEERKYALTLAILPRRTFRRTYEPGCSIGVLTAQLAQRCEQLIGTDIIPQAIESARRRVPADHVDLRVAGIDDWPEGRFDLIVLSELAYYLADAEFEHALARAAESLEEGGVLVAVHWRHPIPGAYRDAEAIHTALAAQPGWVRHASYRDADVLIETFGPPGPSVASAEFLDAEG
ncbi:PIG-L family deacetylase [Brevibacterium sp. R8603A2]|uniref:N-acetylglucosaminyl deacetylase, LmbE family n=1 Tax=Brevibacterium pityocampae TaxID=506594 RepID=A0ABP8JHC7_9MICO|nr:bifunctional PIG-L family deacetylase/class I SAM-dependent methyltransferase [Brevibacterium sp. R8603A2]MCK1803399.1 PIG-L family deacetylase [Brevibacterium sp. R8603A2]